MAISREEIIARKNAHKRPDATFADGASFTIVTDEREGRVKAVSFAEKNYFLCFPAEDPPSYIPAVQGELHSMKQPPLPEEMWAKIISGLEEFPSPRCLNSQAEIDEYKTKVEKRFQAMKLFALSKLPAHTRAAKRRSAKNFQKAMGIVKEFNIDMPRKKL
mmetsp:Transcript_9663/g.12632  ORF Transcript_9663/g.12632 Transcript_9663/m.12632 type:complete len:161 (+) Transcript_9663:117-599(+)